MAADLHQTRLSLLFLSAALEPFALDLQEISSSFFVFATTTET